MKSPVLWYFSRSGADGSRTRVQRQIHRTSTIIVSFLNSWDRTGADALPVPVASWEFSLPHATPSQSFDGAVSYLVDARILTDRYAKSDGCH